jgi:hypothetical protein
MLALCAVELCDSVVHEPRERWQPPGGCNLAAMHPFPASNRAFLIHSRSTAAPSSSLARWPLVSLDLAQLRLASH